MAEPARRPSPPLERQQLLPRTTADLTPDRSYLSWRPVALCLLLPAILLFAHLYSWDSLPALNRAHTQQGLNITAAPTSGESWWLELNAGLTPESPTGKYARHVTSQQGQDGILEYIFDRIGATNKFFVEFGFNEGSWEASYQSGGGTGPNTGNLHANGWSGLLLDGGHENATMNLHQEMIYEHNILELFDKYGVPPEPDYVSVDLDSTDLWVFRKIVTSGTYRPRVLTTEYNCNCPLNGTFSFPNDPSEHWDNTGPGYAGRFYGVCLGALNMVANEAGYSLVYVEKGLDAFFVRNDLLRGPVPAIETFHFALYPHCEQHYPSSREFVGKWVDYPTWLAMGNLQAAKDAALQQMKDLRVFDVFFAQP